MKRTILLRSVFLLLAGMLVSIPVCAEEEKEDSAFGSLTSAAPTPNVNESEIISIFSDHFQTQMGVSINASLGRQIATKKFAPTYNIDNFVYVNKQKGGQKNGIVFNEAIDATNYDIIHVDLFCCATSTKDGLRTRITLGDADGNGGSTVVPYQATLGTAKEGEWTTYEVRISDLVDQIQNKGNSQKPNIKKIKSIWFFDSGDGVRSYFVDNIYFKKDTEKLGDDVAFESLTSLADAPTGVDANNIINVFSDKFESIEQVGVSVGNNNAKAVGRLLKSTSGDNLFFVDSQSGGTKTGIVFNQAIDATDYDKICLDLFSINGGDDGMRPRITLADAVGKGGSTPDTQNAANTIGCAKQGEWKHYELSVSEISSMIAEDNRPDLTKLKSIWFYDYGGQERSYFVDNIYFKRTKTGGSTVNTESATVPVYNIKWASLCLPFAAQVPEGVSAYYAQSTEEGKVVLKMMGDVIPANTAVVINAEENTYGYVFEKTTETGEVIENNLLDGTTAVTRLVENENYVLGGASENGTPVFKLYSRVENGNNNMYLEPYKSYIPKAKVTAASGARTLNFVFDNVTAVDAIENVCSVNKGNYNMSGQRVNENYKGLVIKNGKKVVVE